MTAQTVAPRTGGIKTVADVLAKWGVRSRHGEWSDAETQENCARDVLKVLGITQAEPDPLPLAKFLASSGFTDPGPRDWDRLATHSQVFAVTEAQMILARLGEADDDLRQSLLTALLRP